GRRAGHPTFPAAGPAKRESGRGARRVRARRTPARNVGCAWARGHSWARRMESRGPLPQALGPEDEFAEFAHRSVPASAFADVVDALPHLGPRVRRSCAEADSGEDREVVEVVADVREGLGGKAAASKQ